MLLFPPDAKIGGNCPAGAACGVAMPDQGVRVSNAADRSGAAGNQPATAAFARQQADSHGTQHASDTIALAREYSFLLNSAIDASTLARACWLAARWGTTPHDVLISNGWISERAYARAVAQSCGADCISTEDTDTLSLATPDTSLRDTLRTGVLRQAARGRRRYILTGRGMNPRDIRNTLDGALRDKVALGTPGDLRRTLLRSFGGRLISEACDGLSVRFPGDSARTGLPRTQRAALIGLIVLLALSGLMAPIPTIQAIAVLATLFFACVVSLRLFACIHLAVRALVTGKVHAARIPDHDLPIYTILVPLFREANVLPALMQALARLDYPAAKLDIKLVFESVDDETYRAARDLKLPGNADLIVVPDVQPRTKPKALNYALQFARGEFAVIYDAEDRPEPGQLREAIAAFRRGPPNLACLQARLNFYNGNENWLTRQFTLEYSALFDGLLPALQRLGLPIPLGGTSNHFRVLALKWLGAWDAYNVTEDADLGMRLYRRGYICKMLDSTTYEEATCRFMPWLRQRTRWLKGYLQTYFVHMRAPVALWRELGTRRFLGFHLMIGGVIFSALAHPLFYALLGLEAAMGGIFTMPLSVFGIHIWLLALFNITIGYLASMGLAWLAARRRGLRLSAHVTFMPAYWLMISTAGYRALIQLFHAPFYWEKTEHGLSRQFRQPHSS